MEGYRSCYHFVVETACGFSPSSQTPPTSTESSAISSRSVVLRLDSYSLRCTEIHPNSRACFSHSSLVGVVCPNDRCPDAGLLSPFPDPPRPGNSGHFTRPEHRGVLHAALRATFLPCSRTHATRLAHKNRYQSATETTTPTCSLMSAPQHKRVRKLADPVHLRPLGQLVRSTVLMTGARSASRDYQYSAGRHFNS
jgi:hypothetical protein